MAPRLGACQRDTKSVTFMTDTLETLVWAWTPRLVDLGDGLRFTVRPPTVREALTIMASSESEADQDNLLAVLRIWWGSRMLSAWKDLPTFTQRKTVLTSLLRTGTEQEEDEQEVTEEVDGRMYVFQRNRDWVRLLAEYRTLYSVTLDDLLSEPWPLFMLQVREMEGVHALWMTHNATWYAAAKTGGAMDLAEAAGYVKVVVFKEAEFQTDEWYARQLEKARRLRETHKNLTERRN